MKGYWLILILLLHFTVQADEALDATPGGLPLVIDDPGTPGPDHWEINVLADADFTPSSASYEVPYLDLNYGVGDNIQLKYEQPYTITRGQGADDSRPGLFKVGVKYRFFEDEVHKLFVGTYPQFKTFIDQRGHTTLVPLLIAKRVGTVSTGDVMMTFNLGYNSTTQLGESNFWSGGAAIGLPCSADTIALAEIWTEQSIGAMNGRQRSQLTFSNLGFLYRLKNDIHLLGSVGRSLQSTDGQNHTYALFGLRILSGDD